MQQSARTRILRCLPPPDRLARTKPLASRRQRLANWFAGQTSLRGTAITMASDSTSGRPEGQGEAAGLDPAEMLRMIRQQQEAARDATEPDGRVLFGAWGLAWLIGYLAMWSTARDTGVPAV